MVSPSTLSIILPFFLVSHLSFNSSQAEPSPHLLCSDVQCKEAGENGFFNHNMDRIPCGFLEYSCREGIPKIQFREPGSWYVIKNFSEEEKMLFVQEAELIDHPDLCTALDNFAKELYSLPKYLEVASQKATFFKCGRDDEITEDCRQNSLTYTACESHVLYYFPKNISQPQPPISCGMDKCAVPMQELPTTSTRSPDWSDQNLVRLLDEGFALRWKTPGCFECYSTHPRNSSKDGKKFEDYSPLS